MGNKDLLSHPLFIRSAALPTPMFFCWASRHAAVNPITIVQ